MKNKLSLISCFIVCAVLLVYRCINITPQQPLKVTLWDANGYYLYLPSIIIYHDYKELKWVDSIDKRYQVTGGNGVQAQRADNGNYTFKYLGGVALMELPLFYAAHVYAQHSHYPPDGFSPPYQYALGFGVILYGLIAFLILRRVLLYYYSDEVAAATLLLTGIATNYIQYAAVDNGQSHGYIFLLYALILYATLKWHKQPSAAWALAIGYLCGLATMSRPTEAIIVFIPLMWNTHTKEAAKAKWQAVRANKPHIYLAIIGGILGILPQLIYWKLSTGSFVYDVGSKWRFLDPYFRVLFGFEKGWFIYTPITLLFIIGMFFLKAQPFKKSVLWFGLLNIYIIIAWDDWRYGGSFSTRALVQSYPVLALPMAAALNRAGRLKWRWAVYAACTYLLVVNLFQTWQYDKMIIHYDDMNRRYYSRVYLDAQPSPVDMSVLDSNLVLDNTVGYKEALLFQHTTDTSIEATANNECIVATGRPAIKNGDNWLKVHAEITTDNFWQGYLCLKLNIDKDEETHRVRLFNAISKDGKRNTYEFWVKQEKPAGIYAYRLYLFTPFGLKGVVHNIDMKLYSR